jgi:hypothetical protein
MDMEHSIVDSKMPVRQIMWSDPNAYDGIDPGIRFAVRVLHAAGIETCQSCQGGQGHCYLEPTIEMVCGGDDATGFAALHALNTYVLPVQDIAILWPVKNGLPYERLWRITFRHTMEDRADEVPSFIKCYRHKD